MAGMPQSFGEPDHVTRWPTDVKASDNAKNLHKKFPRPKLQRLGTYDLRLETTSIIHAKDRFRIILMPNLINLVTASLTHVQSIWAINYDAVRLADILISMDDALWHDYQSRIVDADHKRHYILVSRRFRPVVPHSQFEIRRT